MSQKTKILHDRLDKGSMHSITAPETVPNQRAYSRKCPRYARLLSICFVWLPVILAGVFAGCEKKTESIKDPGTIVFTANGEDFVRNGFVDKGGWHLHFDTVLVNLASPTAYSPSGTPTQSLDGQYLVDLATGDENEAVVVVGSASGSPAGNYQSLRFGLRQLNDGPYKGASIVLIGTATRDTETVSFTISLSEELDFDGKEGYVGDEVKGMLSPGDSTVVEMTFHFDHIFGDSQAPPDDHINTGSVGFEFFRRLPGDGHLEISQDRLKNEPEYNTLLAAIRTLGHLGEGHCEAIPVADSPGESN